MTQFCLIRHGQTDWNLEGRYQGQSDVSLNEAGRVQAHALARRLQGRSFAAIYSSDLIRAKETAEIMDVIFQLPIILEPRLREINQGDWEGQLVQVIIARYAQLWQQRIVDPASVRPPGGETIGEVAKRVYIALDDITRLHPNDAVMIVSHGLTLATILCKDREIPIGMAYDMIPENADPIWVNWAG
jgi:broad specificity phosphatase PhoE